MGSIEVSKPDTPDTTNEQFHKPDEGQLLIQAEVQPMLLRKQLGQAISKEMFPILSTRENDSKEPLKGITTAIPIGKGVLHNRENGAILFTGWANEDEMKAVMGAPVKTLNEMIEDPNSGVIDIEQRFDLGDVGNVRYMKNTLDEYQEPLAAGNIYESDSSSGQLEKWEVNSINPGYSEGTIPDDTDTFNITKKPRKGTYPTGDPDDRQKSPEGHVLDIQDAEEVSFITEKVNSTKAPQGLEGWDKEKTLNEQIYSDIRSAIDKYAKKEKFMITENTLLEKFTPLLSVPGKIHVLDRVDNGRRVIFVNKNGSWHSDEYANEDAGKYVNAWLANIK